MKLIAAAFSLFAAVATAQPLTFVTLTAAGSFSDTAIRQAIPAIERHTGREAVVVNAPGANGLIGIQKFLALPADGSTFLIGNSSIGFLTHKGQLRTTLTPLVGLTHTDLALYSHPGIASIKKLVSRPDLKAASASAMTDLSICLFDANTNATTTIVNYKEFGQALLDVAAARVDYVIAPVGAQAVEAMESAKKIHRLQSLGSAFAWNAIFMHPLAQPSVTSHQIISAIRQTNFSGMKRFDEDAQGIVQIQLQEAAVMARCNSHGRGDAKMAPRV